jgi:nicotinamidase-related amidase
VTALPEPPSYDPGRVGGIWRVSFGERAGEAEEWARRHAIRAAAEDGARVCLLCVDCQNTFCSPGFELFVGGRSGRGAVDDVARLCSFLYRNLAAITEVVVTLDTHHAMQIFHPAALVGPDGRHPEPYTLVSVEDVETGRWRLDDAFVESVGLSEAEGREHLAHYVRSLARSGKYDLTIWPYHALLGSIGHALVPSVAEAVFFHGIARGTRPTLVEKGASPLTEHYSILGPEVLDDARGRPIGVIDEALIERLLSFDAVFVAGQAKSHCVAWTVADLLEQGAERDGAFAGRLFLLEDCTSAVVVPGAIDYTDAAAAAFDRFAARGVRIVRSTDPIPGS